VLFLKGIEKFFVSKLEFLYFCKFHKQEGSPETPIPLLRSNGARNRLVYIQITANQSLLRYAKMNLLIILVALTLILVPTFALISSSQSTNETLSDHTTSNQTFSDWSRELGENQSDSNGESGDDNE
jgi:hypothetical protein